MSKEDYLMTALLSDDFKFQISLGNITQDNQHHFKDLKTKISVSKGTANYINKLFDLVKLQLADSLKKQREIMELGSDPSQVDYYFKSPLHLGKDHEN